MVLEKSSGLIMGDEWGAGVWWVRPVFIYGRRRPVQIKVKVFLCFARGKCVSDYTPAVGPSARASGLSVGVCALT